MDRGCYRKGLSLLTGQSADHKVSDFVPYNVKNKNARSYLENILYCLLMMAITLKMFSVMFTSTVQRNR